jgi:phosphoglycerol transferase MdoB-like AlkP superfamily enzyme
VNRALVLKVLATSTAAVAWCALGAQLILIIQKMTGEGESVTQAVWRFFGFFTILTNCAVAVVATAMAIKPNSVMANASARLATATAIFIVGLVYSVALRAIWQPTGWQAVIDHALHDATPVLFILSWFFAKHGQLKTRHAFLAVVPAFIYFIYALVRGAADGWYAYWFLNPASLTPAQMVINVVILLLAFSVVALAFVRLDKWLAQRDETL